MSFGKYFETFKHIDSLIRHKATGNTKCLAKKLGQSRTTTLEYLKEMKQLGFPIKYSRKRGSYYYTEEGKMTGYLFIKEMNDEELRRVSGGKSFFQLFPKSGNTGL